MLLLFGSMAAPLKLEQKYSDNGLIQETEGN